MSAADDAAWLEEIKKDVEDSVGGSPSPIVVPVEPLKKKNDNTPLVLLVLLLLVMIVMALDYRSPGIVSNYISDLFSKKETPQVQLESRSQTRIQRSPTYPDPWPVIKEMQQAMKMDKDRLVLVGTLHNHNTAVIQGNYPKSELIYINRDWTIDRLPNRITLTEQDRVFLQRFLRK